MKKCLLWMLLVSIILLTGCDFGGLSFNQAKHQRSEQHYFPMAGIEAIDVDTLFGAINIEGSDTKEASIEAKITTHAPTAEEAQQIAEQTKIKIEPSNMTLNIYLQKPELKNNRSVGVSFTIRLPKDTAVKANTSYGPIHVSNITKGVQANSSFAVISCNGITGPVDVHTSYGNISFSDIVSDSIKGKTSFSSIKCEDVSGPVDLVTSYGHIKCDNLTTDKINARSSFGNINIDCSDKTKDTVQAYVKTSYGNIRFNAPPNYAGALEANTSYGDIDSDLAVTVKDKFDKDKLVGTVGNGSGNLKLNTSFGSIRIK